MDMAIRMIANGDNRNIYLAGKGFAIRAAAPDRRLCESAGIEHEAWFPAGVLPESYSVLYRKELGNKGSTVSRRLRKNIEMVQTTGLNVKWHWGGTAQHHPSADSVAQRHSFYFRPTTFIACYVSSRSGF